MFFFGIMTEITLKTTFTLKKNHKYIDTVYDYIKRYLWFFVFELFLHDFCVYLCVNYVLSSIQSMQFMHSYSKNVRKLFFLEKSVHFSCVVCDAFHSYEKLYI